MQINAKFYLDTLYIQIVGELDEHTASHARTAIDTQLDGAECKQVVIDLSKLEFMDSTGIGIMMGRYKKMKQSFLLCFLFLCLYLDLG